MGGRLGRCRAGGHHVGHRMVEFSRLFERTYGFAVPPHIWMGTSVENGGTAARIDELRRTRFHVRFVSFEPLLGMVDRPDLSGMDWAIIGGESGPRHRPVLAEWGSTWSGSAGARGSASFSSSGAAPGQSREGAC